MSSIVSVLSLVVRFGVYLAALAGVVITVIINLSVVRRYLLESPLSFSDELSSLLFSSWVLLAIPFLFAFDKNIRVMLIVENYPPRMRSLVERFSDLLIIAFFLILGSYSLSDVMFVHRIKASTDVAEISIAPWMAMLPLSCFLSALVVAARIVPSVRKRLKDKSDNHEDVLGSV